jgi:hypothetical protein
MLDVDCSIKMIMVYKITLFLIFALVNKQRCYAVVLSQVNAFIKQKLLYMTLVNLLIINNKLLPI